MRWPYRRIRKGHCSALKSKLRGVFGGKAGAFEQLALLLGVLPGCFLLLPISLSLGLLLSVRLFLLVFVESFLLLLGGLTFLAITFGDAGVLSLSRGRSCSAQEEQQGQGSNSFHARFLVGAGKRHQCTSFWRSC